MIKFCTDTTKHDVQGDISVEEVNDYIQRGDEISFDFETSGLFAKEDIPLLLAIYNNKDDYAVVVDLLSVNLNDINLNKPLIAHNAKFDYSWLYHYGVKIQSLFCTYITEKKIYQGSNRPASLVAVCRHRGIPITTNKDIREQFIGTTREHIFTKEQIEYAANDVFPLLPLKQSQLEDIESNNLHFFINIHNQLTRVLAEAEAQGFVYDKEKALDFIETLEEKQDEIVKDLYDYLDWNGVDINGINPKKVNAEGVYHRKIERYQERIRKNTELIKRYESQNKTHLKAYTSAKDSLEKAQTGLEEIEYPEEEYINWSSSQQVLTLLEQMNIHPLPKDKDQKTKQLKPALSKAARTVWLSENEDHKHYQLLKLYNEYKKYRHVINSFGTKWIENYLREDGKVYTIFRQAGPATGRFSSGDKDNGFFNLQQIPKTENEKQEPVFRECLGTDPGRSIATLDFSGCEVVCMIGLSGDLSLKKVSELKDQHSYMGTKCWRNIYKKRYENTGDYKWKELADNYEMGEGPERTKFKNSGIFPVIYGVHSKKVASIQGFSHSEGQIFIDTIENEMPVVVNYVKSKAEEALRTGKVIHNTRTNSYRLFDRVTDHYIYGDDLSFMDKIQVSSAARNSPIQGTNADIICEAIVAIDKWIKINHLDIRLLGQVHDELIYDMPDDYVTWAPVKIEQLMCRVANNYLIPEVEMKATHIIKKTWTK